MAVYAYTRVSTGRQADEGESLGAQQRRVDGYAQMNDLRVDRHFVERGVSGSVPLAERPQGGALLDLVKPGDVIITPKLDRCFRSALDALDVLQKLKERGVSLHMIDLGGDVTGNGISKLLFTILSAVAEAERDRIRERITDVKRDQRQRGRYLGAGFRSATASTMGASRPSPLRPCLTAAYCQACVDRLQNCGVGAASGPPGLECRAKRVGPVGGHLQ